MVVWAGSAVVVVLIVMVVVVVAVDIPVVVAAVTRLGPPVVAVVHSLYLQSLITTRPTPATVLSPLL
jgi:hypothetical protein